MAKQKPLPCLPLLEHLGPWEGSPGYVDPDVRLGPGGGQWKEEECSETAVGKLVGTLWETKGERVGPMELVRVEVGVLGREILDQNGNTPHIMWSDNNFGAWGVSERIEG